MYRDPMPNQKDNMIYTITLTNKKTGQEISRDYNLCRMNSQSVGEVLYEMYTALNDHDCGLSPEDGCDCANN